MLALNERKELLDAASGLLLLPEEIAPGIPGVFVLQKKHVSGSRSG
jgi:hypothetical protein